MCKNVLYFDSHVLPTINVINYVPRFTIHVYGHVMSEIEVIPLKLTWRTETLCYVWSMN